MVAGFTYGFAIASEAFRKSGVELATLSDYEHLVEVARETGYVKEGDMETLREWREAPAEWRK